MRSKRKRRSPQRALAQVDILNQQIAALRKQLIGDPGSARRFAGVRQGGAGQDRRSRSAPQYRAGAEGAGARRAIARISSAACARFSARGRTSASSATASCSNPRCCSNPTRPTSAPRAASRSTAWPPPCIDLEREIPPDIPWILRIDGHTDSKAITGGQFKSNWELSAARAIAVVQYLISKGIEPTRLAAAGFGEFQPIDTGTDDEALARNRRIELKLTER